MAEGSSIMSSKAPNPRDSERLAQFLAGYYLTSSEQDIARDAIRRAERERDDAVDMLLVRDDDLNQAKADLASRDAALAEAKKDAERCDRRARALAEKERELREALAATRIWQSGLANVEIDAFERGRRAGLQQTEMEEEYGPMSAGVQNRLKTLEAERDTVRAECERLRRVVAAARTCRDRIGVTEELDRELSALENPRPTPVTSGEPPRYKYSGEKPTIHELEEILEQQGNEAIDINPDGSISITASPSAPADLPRKEVMQHTTEPKQSLRQGKARLDKTEAPTLWSGPSPADLVERARQEPAPWCCDALFVLTTVGDGEATTLHHGWTAICDAVVNVHYHEPDADQRKEVMTWFLDWEEWSNAPDGFPWRWEKHHEDGAVYVWRVTDPAAFAAERAEASRREWERAVGSLVSHFLSSFDAAFWDNHPRPWRVEEDWTCEITAANGRIIAKLPYPRDLDIAHEVAAAGNAYEITTEEDAEELLRALSNQPQADTTEAPNAD